MRLRAAAVAVAGAGLAATVTWFAPFAGAQIYEGEVQVVGDCEGVALVGTGAHILDRDNTGEGSETWSVVVRDGSGVEIANETYSNTLGTYPAGMAEVTFDAAPTLNPISVVVVSLAGNGLPEVADAPRTVSCDSLPGGQQPTPSTRPEIVTTTTRPVTTTTSRPVTTTTTSASTTTTTGSPTSTTLVTPTLPPVDTVPGPPVVAPSDTRNCTEIGQVNIPRGHSLYRPDLDSDGDGVACESGAAQAARPIAAGANYAG